MYCKWLDSPVTLTVFYVTLFMQPNIYFQERHFEEEVQLEETRR